jgi:uncharacterized protein YkwD
MTGTRLAPREGMARTARVPLVAILLLWSSFSPVAPNAAAAAGGGGGAAVITSSIVDLTNVERSRAGLSPLRAEERLMKAAQLQAEQMASLGRMDHVLRDGPYPSPQDRLAAAGYRWRAFAENIAYGQRGPEDVTGSWMGSSGHRANMLNGAYTELGTGYAVDNRGRPYFVQVFGKPM